MTAEETKKKAEGIISAEMMRFAKDYYLYKDIRTLVEDKGVGATGYPSCVLSRLEAAGCCFS